MQRERTSSHKSLNKRVLNSAKDSLLRDYIGSSVNKHESTKLYVQIRNCMGFSTDKAQVRGINQEIREESRG